ncbi:hypothetical protein MAR_031151 [Mya arenaria]|uniref:Peptidase C2 calpain large subunit domain-containing protein n=1 Tax=Mya arenaria TaxID=6604 RepID=A0ABY7F6A4_MYAAR|nr:hypothetical protein MAR_031151 [Mya arenaria]
MEYEIRDEISWGTVNAEFLGKYKPLVNKDQSEYWMTLEDFRCNFGGLIICSSDVPYTTDALTTDRCYRRMSEEEIKSDRRRSSEGKHNRSVGDNFHSLHRNSQPYVERKKKHSAYAKLAFTRTSIPSEPGITNDTGILVRENTKTVKVDNSSFNKLRSKRHSNKQSKSDTLCMSKHQRKKSAFAERAKSAEISKPDLQVCERANSADDMLRTNDKEGGKGKAQLTLATDKHVGKLGASNCSADRQNQNTETGEYLRRDSDKVPALSQTKHPLPSPAISMRKESVDFVQTRSDSLVSNSSAISDCHSTFSASDITLNMQSGLSRENSFKRPKSAPGNFVRSASSGSLPNMVVNNFIASSSDNFRSHGSWRYIIEYRGKWEKSESGVSSVDMKLHSRNPRILLNILHPDAINRIVAPGYHGRSHVIVSLMQDYRHGAKTANSLLMPIGFSIYKRDILGENYSLSTS